MEAFVNQFDLGAVLDGVAVTCSLVMILFLLYNRRKFGRFVLKAPKGKNQSGFADQVSLHMMTQQSQKAYDNLQHSLTREFASLRAMGADLIAQRPNGDRGLLPKTAVHGSRERRQRYRMAEEMIIRGESVDRITRQCGLMEGELELLRGLQQLAEARAYAQRKGLKTPAAV